jgi:hypothetical protein
VSTPSSELPPPPAPPAPTTSATQIAGQQMAPSSSVPVAPPGAAQAASTGSKTNTLALVSFISALVAPLGHFTGVGGFTLIAVSIVTGHLARGQIRKSGESGAQLALAGLIISYIHLALSLIAGIFFFGLFIAFFTGAFGGAH